MHTGKPPKGNHASPGMSEDTAAALQKPRGQEAAAFVTGGACVTFLRLHSRPEPAEEDLLGRP